MVYNKIEPAGLLLKLLFLLPSIKNFYLKRGYTLERFNKEFDEKILKNPEIGLSSIFAGILVGLLPMIFFFGLHCFYIKNIAKPKNFESFLVIFISYSIISFLFSYILLFHKDKYLKYFKEFDKKPRKWKVKWAWISLGVILFPFIVLASSFWAMAE